AQGHDRPTGSRIDHMPTTLVGARGRDREIRSGHDPADLVQLPWMPDPDLPPLAVARAAAGLDVPAELDAMVHRTGRAEPLGRDLPGPPLHVPARVQPAGRVHVEVAVGALPQFRAALDHQTQICGAVVQYEGAVAQPADLTVHCERCEPAVDF